MDRASRAFVASLAGGLILEKEGPFIYDCLEAEHENVKALFEENRPELSDCLENLGEKYFVYETAKGTVYLNIAGGRFKGYDSGNVTLFAGGAKGNMVVLYVNKYKEFYKYRFCTHAERDFQCGARCHECVGAETES